MKELTYLLAYFATAGSVAWAVAPAATSQALPRKDELSMRLTIVKAGQEGYHTFRIPAMIATPKGTLLFFCEGRRDSARDDGSIDLVMRRSSDKGASWSALQVIYRETGKVTIGNPAPVVDHKTGHIHLLFTRENERLFSTISQDDGKTWSAPREHTHSLSKWEYPRVMVATGPGHAIQLRSGRMIVPVWISDRPRHLRFKDTEKTRIRAGVIYSDDAGESWLVGGLVPAEINRLHEWMILERSDGTLLGNLRAHGAGSRVISQSTDAGLNWSSPVLDTSLPDSTCQASILTLAGREVVFANPAVSKTGGVDAPSRRNFTIRLSTDEGATFQYARVLHAGPAGYSDLARTSDGLIVVAFECGEKLYHERIDLACFGRDWIVTHSTENGRQGP